MAKSKAKKVIKKSKADKASNAVLAALHQLLADLSDGYSQAKQAHWTVKGPHFLSYHNLFDEVASALNGAVDDVAERIQQLGGHAVGTVRATAQKTRLKEYPLQAIKGADHIKAVSDLLAHLAKTARHATEVMDDADDDVSEDMLIGITAMLDKQHWFVSSHL
jgi:starvation-inducible DNA-binding protein